MHGTAKRIAATIIIQIVEKLLAGCEAIVFLNFVDSHHFER